MAFDLSTAKPVSGGFDLSTARPVEQQDDPRQEGYAAGEAETPVGAALGQFVKQAPILPIMPYIQAGANYALDAISGDKKSYADELAYQRGRSEGEMAAHGIAGTIGGVAGGLAGAGEINAGVKAVKAAATNLPKVGPLLAKTGQVIAGDPYLRTAARFGTGAAIGGGTAVSEGKSGPDVGIDALAGGAAGLLVPPVAKWVINKAAGASTQAMAVLSKAIDMAPAELQRAYDSFVKVTGTTPSMAQLADMKSRGALRDLAANNENIGAAAKVAAQQGGAPLHVQVAAANAANRPQTSSDLISARDQFMTGRMSAVNPATGRALRAEPIDTSTGTPANTILNDPLVTHALATDTRVLGNTGIQDRIDNNRFTMDDLDQVREALRSKQTVYANPNNPSHDRGIAQQFGAQAQKVEGLGRSAYPEYGTALDEYRHNSRYNTGFVHGLKGKPFNDAPDQLTARDLGTAAGRLGYLHGQALYTGQQALRDIAPGSVAPNDEMSPAEAVHTAVQAVKASPSVITKALSVIGGKRLPGNVQDIISRQLFDPSTTQQGILNLRRAGLRNDEIQQLANTVGGVAGAHIAQTLAASQPTQGQ